MEYIFTVKLQDGLVSLLGVKNFELFAARLKELKLCEDFCK